MIRDINEPISSNGLHAGWTYADVKYDLFLAPDAELVFGERHNGPAVPGAQYKDSDLLPRLPGWREAYAQALNPEDGSTTAADLEQALRTTFNAPSIALKHIIVGVNQGNGYPYQRYGFFPDGTQPAIPIEEWGAVKLYIPPSRLVSTLHKATQRQRR